VILLLWLNFSRLILHGGEVVTASDGVFPLPEVSEARARLAREPFGILDWTVDVSTGRIHRGDEEVRLEPKVMDVLVYLASRPEEVVTRSELEDNVWTQVVVSYETLTSSVQKLRKAFDDDARNPRVIETLSKRGYRLIAPVSWPENTAQGRQSGDAVDAPMTAAPRRQPVILGALLALALLLGLSGYWIANYSPPPPTGSTSSLPLTAKPAIAVLPFVNLSDDKAQEYFSDGMTEDLITDLSKISNLSVISRTSTSVYKGLKFDIREVGKTLGVRYVIVGSVRKAGEQIRINAQLIDAASGSHLWAERYDGKLRNIFDLQDQVLEKIVASLALKLSQEERQRLAKGGTDNVEAHDLYMRGLFQESRFNREGNREALRLYEQALAIDPGYALPYNRISNIFQMNARSGWSDNVQADLNKAVALAEKAIALDPENPASHWSLGRAVARLKAPGALKRGIAALKRAIELDPDFADAHAFLGVLYVSDGRAEEGLRSIETAMRLNPLYPFWYLYLRGMSRYVVEDYQSAIADFEAAAARSPTVLFVRWWLAASYAQVGRQDDAEWQLEEMKLMEFEGTIATIVETQPMRDPRYLSLQKEGLRKAGIPEQ